MLICLISLMDKKKTLKCTDISDEVEETKASGLHKVLLKCLGPKKQIVFQGSLENKT